MGGFANEAHGWHRTLDIPGPACPLSEPGASPQAASLLRSFPEFQSVLAARRGGEKETVAARYARHHKQTTKKIHVFSGAEF